MRSAARAMIEHDARTPAAVAALAPAGLRLAGLHAPRGAAIAMVAFCRS